MGQPKEKYRMPHERALSLEPFQKWGLDFIGPFKTATARIGIKYIIVVTEYCTEWVKAKPLRDNTTTFMTRFLYEFIWCRPIELVTDQGTHFVNEVIYEFSHYYVVVHKRSTPYYPQQNGLTESTNKILQHIMKKIGNENQTNWVQKLHSALWVYRTTYKMVIRLTPFRMTFGLDAVMPIEFLIPSL